MNTDTVQKLYKLKSKADNAYFNSASPIMTDDDYDALCRQLEELQPLTNKICSVGCSPPQDLKKIKLPVYMGSLSKHNDDKTINHFLNKFNHIESFVVQEKLDGISCLYLHKKNKIKLYTRGNGQIGTDITHLIDYGLKLPHINGNKNLMIRGELIVSKKKFISQFQEQFKNIRNMVSGQVTAKIPNALIVENIDFVAYELICDDNEKQHSLITQYHKLKNLGFKVVFHRTCCKEYINKETLKDYLDRRKNKSKYEIDGLVITINYEYERNLLNNPKYAFAFKIQGETAEVTVDHVKWNLSKSGKYKPQIFIKPVELSGVTISSLTGFNARYVVDNTIVPGTSLLITRSGDVIPHIIVVLDSPKNERVKLPKNSRWISVDLYHNFEEDPDEVIIKQMVHFFTSLKCLNCKDKTIIKIFNSGYKTIESLIEARLDDLATIEGIGTVLASKLLSSIKTNIKMATAHELLAALNAFGEGIGLRKIQLLDLSNPENLKIKGLGEATIKEKILPVWKVSLDRVARLKAMVGGTIEKEECKESGYNPLQGRIFVFTGFRDTSLEKQIFDLGGKVTSAISKKSTDLVVISDQNTKSSTKLLKAQELGIQITTKLKLSLELQKLRHQNFEEKEVDYDHYSSSEDE